MTTSLHVCAPAYVHVGILFLVWHIGSLHPPSTWMCCTIFMIILIIFSELEIAESSYRKQHNLGLSCFAESFFWPEERLEINTHFYMFFFYFMSCDCRFSWCLTLANNPSLRLKSDADGDLVPGRAIWKWLQMILFLDWLQCVESERKKVPVMLFRTCLGYEQRLNYKQKAWWLGGKAGWCEFITMMWIYYDGLYAWEREKIFFSQMNVLCFRCACGEFVIET